MFTPKSKPARRSVTCSPQCRSERIRRSKTKPPHITLCSHCGTPVKSYPSRIHRRYCQRGCPGPVVTWNEATAYFLGLLSSDGCIHNPGYRVSFASNDDYLLTVAATLMPEGHISGKKKCRQAICTWRHMHEFARNIGIHPRKSLTLGPLQIPDVWFWHFYRGVHDGDGTTFWSERKSGTYLRLSLSSYAPDFRAWLQNTIHRLSGVRPGNSEKTHTLSLDGKKAEHVASFIWQNATYELPRKVPIPPPSRTSETPRPPLPCWRRRSRGAPAHRTQFLPHPR